MVLSGWVQKTFTVREKKPTVVVTPPVTFHQKIDGGNVYIWVDVKNTAGKDLGTGCVVKFWVKSNGGINLASYTSCDSGGVLKAGSQMRYESELKSVSSGEYVYWATVEYGGEKISVFSSN